MGLSQRTTDTIFGVGLASAIFWCGSQAVRALTSTTGVSLAWVAAFFLGFVIQLSLAIVARRKKPGRIITQMLVLFGAWASLSLVLLVVVASRASYVWSPTDTTIVTSSVVGLALVAAWAVRAGVPISDAAVKSWINIVLKTIPQFLLVLKILSEGSGGITTIAIVTGSVSILARLGPMSLLLSRGGATREEKWLWVTDAVNLSSWLTVTLAWAIK